MILELTKDLWEYMKKCKSFGLPTIFIIICTYFILNNHILQEWANIQAFFKTKKLFDLIITKMFYVLYNYELYISKINYY